MPRRSLLMLSRLLIGALLFAQMAVAAYACPRLAAAAGIDMTALSVTSPNPTAPEASPAPAGEQLANCDGMNGAMDPSSANLCAEHCRYGQQSDQAPTLSVPVVLLTTLYITSPVPALAMPPHGVASATSALAAASPPHAILHCCFRI